MHGSAKHTLVAVAAGSLCISLFCIPLFLRYNVFRDTLVSLTSTDEATITDRISSVWCSAQTITSDGNSTFEAYVLPAEPTIIVEDGPSVSFSHYSVLSVSGVEYWGFFLLKGSKMNVSTCARLPGATLTIVRGQHTLSRCLGTFRSHSQDLSDESEESVEDEENPSSSISSSEGVFSEEATKEGAFHCPGHSLHHKTLNLTFSCSKKMIDFGRNLRYLETTDLVAEHTDYYYMVFSCGAVLDLMSNEVHWRVDISRTVFDLGPSLRNCSSTNDSGGSCSMPLTFASSQTTVVKMLGPQIGSVPQGNIILSTCEPRKGLYFVFFVLILLTIGICALQ